MLFILHVGYGFPHTIFHITDEYSGLDPNLRDKIGELCIKSII